MDDSATRMKANMEKVLRAMDVIPPFCSDDKQNTRGGDSMPGGASLPRAERQRRASGQKSDEQASDPKKTKAKGKITIPEFDLGERILAAQRRMTAKKRRAPGALGETDQDGLIEEAVVAPRTLLAVPSVDELTQLERIVADIVARDIERLCTGPARTLN